MRPTVAFLILLTCPIYGQQICAGPTCIETAPFGDLCLGPACIQAAPGQPICAGSTCLPAVITVCASGCTTSSLQTALDTTSACGDIISIKSTEIQTGNFHLKDRGCASNKKITVTSDRAAWLPIAGTRITPSHLSNMAVIRTPNTAPAIDGVLTDGVPPKHWKFIGVAFTTSNVGSYTDNLILPKNYIAASNSELPDDFTFDRCYFYTPLPNGTVTGVNLSNHIQAGVSNLTVRDSFFGDVAYPGFEAHTILFNTEPGPAAIRNNYMIASGSTVFGSGTGTFPDYPVWPTNITVQYNYTWRPWKWNNDASQPYYSYFLANKAFNDDTEYLPCLKNSGEFKIADTILWQYNMHENMWAQAECQGQHPGFAMTMRPAFDASAASEGGMGTISFTDTTHLTWSAAGYNIPTVASIGYVSSLSYGLCVNITGGAICRPFTTFDNTAKTITVSTAFPSAPAGNFEYSIAYSGGGTLSNISVLNNVYKNHTQFINNLGIAAGNGVGTSGKLTSIIVKNNLIWNSLAYMTGADFWKGTPAEDSYAADSTTYELNHNTMFSAVNMNSFFTTSRVTRGTTTRQNKWDAWDVKNNLLGPSATFTWTADDTSFNFDQGMLLYASNSTFKNNGIPGGLYNPPPGPPADGACTGSNTCSGNIATAWSDPFIDSTGGDFCLTPGGIYSNAGTDGLDLGADCTQLPMITGLTTTPTATTALLEFDLAAPIIAAKTTQPCVLEVSASSNLQSDLDVYTVTPDLNPTYFKQPDTSARTNSKLLPVTLAAGHVSWPIGQAATVVGDDGVSHNLRLTPATLYYGRLMCYGATEWFTFTTAP